jgi:TatD DNase family protein
MSDRGLDTRAILEQLARDGAGTLVDVAIQPEDLARRRELTSFYSPIFYSIGLHPSRSDRDDWREAIERCDRILGSQPIDAVGEMGLDWYREYAPRDRQIEVMEAQLALARTYRRPVIVHNRDADQEVLDLLRAASLPSSGIMHCYSSGPEWVDSFLDAGMYISFAGNVTFRSAERLREALARVPDDRLLLETDAPFLAPVPHRGAPNHPGYIVHTYRIAADVRGVTIEEVVDTVARNVDALFSPGATERESREHGR